jgi:SAM-dependent methyltransferase
MVDDTSINIARCEQDSARLNAERWARGDLVDAYSTRALRRVEEVLIERHRTALEGRVLELGCGAGRLTGYLSELSPEVHGLDLSPAMVAYCQRTYPRASFSVGDLRDLSAYEAGSDDVVLAPFNVLDVLGDAARRRTLMQIRDLLAFDGLLVMSSHNIHYARRARTKLRLWIRLLVGSPRRPAASLRGLPRRFGNRHRLRSLQRTERDYAIVNDEAHDFSVLHYYISRDAQERQLREAGYELLECLDLDGQAVEPGEAAANCPELHYVARRQDA